MIHASYAVLSRARRLLILGILLIFASALLEQKVKNTAEHHAHPLIPLAICWNNSPKGIVTQALPVPHSGRTH